MPSGSSGRYRVWASTAWIGDQANAAMERRLNMSFIDEYRALEAAVKDFDHQSVDLTILSDSDLHELESSRLPLYRLHEQAYKERLRRCEIQMETRRKEQERLKARYGYRYPEKEELNAIDVLGVEAFESGIMDSVFDDYDGEEAKEKIHEMIPAITDAEIDEYRRAGGKE